MSGTLRSVAQILEHNAQTAYIHVKSHQGDPWNEMADIAARLTAQGIIPKCHPNLDATSLLTSAAAWSWLTAANEYITQEIPFQYFFTRKVVLAFAARMYIYFPGGFDEVNAIVIVFFQAGSHCKYVGVENNILRREPYFFS